MGKSASSTSLTTLGQSLVSLSIHTDIDIHTDRHIDIHRVIRKHTDHTCTHTHLTYKREGLSLDTQTSQKARRGGANICNPSAAVVRWEAEAGEL